MDTSTRVRIWKIGAPYKGKRKTTYKVRWTVAGKPFSEPCSTKALADAFRSKLLSATTDGVPFDTGTGLPVTMLRKESAPKSWYDFACSYVDRMWPESSPGHRRTIADALIPITVAMLSTDRGRPNAKVLRAALRTAFNTRHRDDKHAPDIADALTWAARNTRPVSDLTRPDFLRGFLNAVETKLDGKRVAQDTARLRRTTLGSALEYAIEQGVLSENPLKSVKTKKRKTVTNEVDRRSVANPVQARTLLLAVNGIQRSGPSLVAFFALMYFAALRPEEAANLRKHNLSLPERGWGELHLESAAPEVSGRWTDSGQAREERALKHREEGTGRVVPCSPELTSILHNHLTVFGTTADGRLFRAERGGRVGSSTYGRVWALARQAVLTPEVAASPLARRPYDLRHACVSTWLNAGVEATRVAEWAGHSVAVLLRVYAKCLDGGEQSARQRVQAALGGAPNLDAPWT
ncbi:tyrosine-type recombinase/integrase [Saccharothrix yanglingensis]|uniref:Integrase n=1 Tax=Saccharothrix yanglingensis TaxID=659496 RepID=A0ABU0WS02_9PSEU|nr:tyrosine-type recombinase/integrase [Saccharothrix yanglingensis]MDQ2582609.1 integrase [Saccharothrix yanglingensis]